MKPVIILLLLASSVWFFMFSPISKGLFNFWLLMFIASGILAIIGIIYQRKNLASLFYFRKNHIAAGIISAALLYFIFLAGSLLSVSIFPFAKAETRAIYALRGQGQLGLVALALFFWIGPAEEIFWRGFVQERISRRFGKNTGLVLAALAYAGVHAFALNLMLFLAALICGIFWGMLFRRYRSLWPAIFSHAIWDVLIFVLLPIQ